ncbi:MAG: hypothetical protein DME50_18475 [Verrucomicrobia bacterium]|nr:MAG: hypothetical protein DME50_18475 [Verrucomicrobiota bacterium]
MPIDKKFKELVIVATYLSPGVKSGASGFAIVNGKIVIIPPRGPASRLLQDALQAIIAETKRAGR